MKLGKPLWEKAGVALVPLVFIVAAWVFIPNFSSPGNLIYSLGLSLTTTGIVACGMLFALASGDFDLSVGSVAAFAGMSVVVLISKGVPPWPAVGLSLLGSTVIGMINGFVISVCGINALITTLASMQIVRGVAYLLHDGNSLGLNTDQLTIMGNQLVLGVPMPIWILTTCLIICGLLLHRTVFGRNTLAIGGNAEAARLAGLPTAWIKIAIFGLLSTLAGLAGIVSTSQQQMGDPKSMSGLELRVISACVLGGVSLTGGVGAIYHVVAGMLVMGIVQNVMDLKSVPTFYQYLISGAILLAAVLVDRFKQVRMSKQK